MSVLNVPWLPAATPAQVCSLGEEVVMILLLTIRLERSLRLSCPGPSKQPLINFYPAIPMSPGSAATQQQKALIKPFGESFDVTLADFRSPKEKLLEENSKQQRRPQNPPLHSPYCIFFPLVSRLFFHGGHKSGLSLAPSCRQSF